MNKYTPRDRSYNIVKSLVDSACAPDGPEKDAEFEARLARIDRRVVIKAKRTEERISWALDGLL